MQRCVNASLAVPRSHEIGIGRDYIFVRWKTPGMDLSMLPLYTPLSWLKVEAEGKSGGVEP